VVDVLEVVRPHVRIGLDTSVFIYHIEASSPFSGAASQVLQHVGQPAATGVTSVLTLTELLVKPLQSGRRGLAARYDALVRVTPNLVLAEVDAEIARHAAVLRAKYRLRTPDAIQVAACLAHGATAFVTNGFGLRRIEELAVIVLADHVDG
jgi:predicted nucleic acid-binding protein